jgi:hypothetical protein
MSKILINLLISILFCVGYSSPTAADGSNTYVDQIPGDTLVLQQSGSANSATIEQQAILGASHTNSVSIQQSGMNSCIDILQQGQQNNAAIIQSGNDDKIIASQNGAGLGLQISQYGNNSSVGATQFGTGGGIVISVRQFR